MEEVIPSPDFFGPILIVDDDEISLEYSRRLIMRAAPAAPVTIVLGGPEGMEYLFQTGTGQPGAPIMPRVVFLDVRMPMADGFEILSWLRRHTVFAELKVFMLSSSDTRENIARATELGADGFLLKWPTPKVLASLFSRAPAPENIRVEVPSRGTSHSLGLERWAVGL